MYQLTVTVDLVDLAANAVKVSPGCLELRSEIDALLRMKVGRAVDNLVAKVIYGQINANLEKGVKEE
jgi:hypothetical protein